MSGKSIRKKLHFLILFIVVYVAGSAEAQKFAVDLKKYTVKDGLPHRSTYDIIKDKNGYIWLSYQGGICRFDGLDFKSYNSTLLNISNSNPVTFACDAENRIWFSETEGIKKQNFSGVLDTRKDTVYRIENLTNGLIQSTEVLNIHSSQAEPGVFFIATKKGVVYKVDNSPDNIQKIFEIESPISGQISGHSVEESIHWVFYKNLSWELNLKKGTRKEFPFPGKLNLRRLFKTPAGITAELRPSNRDIRYFTFEKGKWSPQENLPGKKEDFYYSLFFQDEEFTVFVAGTEFFVRDCSENNHFEFSDPKLINPKVELRANNVLKDNNVYWIVTNNGFFKLTYQKLFFRNYMGGTSVRGIFRKNKQLFIGGYGVKHRIDLETGRAKRFDANIEVINSFCEDQDGIIWLGMDKEKIGKFDLSDSTLTYKKLDDKHIGKIVYHNPKTNRLLIGTNRNGVLSMDKNTGEVTSVLRNSSNVLLEVRQFYPTEEGIWVATCRGIYLLDKISEKVIGSYTSKNSKIPNENILYLMQDSEGVFWIGTKGGGLIRWDRKQGVFQQFTRNEGLTNNTIYAVFEDDFGSLWLTSNYGLMNFNKKSHEILAYQVKNGIPHEEFNTYSYHEAEDGTFYFGGLNGVVEFHPKDFQINQNSDAPLYFSKIEVLNEDDVAFSDKTETFNELKKIVLSPDDRTLRITAVLLDYMEPKKNKFAYKIEGYQKQWVNSFSNQIAIPKPEYGNYILKIKGRGSSGKWSDQILEIPLAVVKPFYLKGWFWVLAFFSIAGFIFSLFWYRIVRLQKRQKFLKSEVKKRTEIIEKDKQTILAQAESLKELDVAKTRFFSNIAHEIRTPLTLMTGPLQQVIEEQKNGSPLQQRLMKIAANGNQLLQLINQLLDISKLETGKAKPEYSLGDIAGFTRDLVSRFEPAAEEKNIYLKNITGEGSWITQFDTEKWSKIVHNLLSNAVKFTDSGGKITVELYDAEKNEKPFIGLTVKDSGIGMTKAQVKKIYNRFYQADNSSTRERSGSGIGLSLVKELVELHSGEINVVSELGVGTEFRILLPTVKESVVSEVEIETSSPDISNEKKSFKILSNPNGDYHQTGSVSILLIEDNTEMLDYIKSCLSPEKFTVLEAPNGEIGLEIAINEQPDLIISDVMMPKKDGYQLTRELRENIITSHIPIILLTAKVNENSRLEGLATGANVYLTKPFKPHELNMRIENFLQLRERIRYRLTYPNQFPQNGKFKPEEEFIQQIKDFVLENIEEGNLNGDVIGRHIGMSRMNLHRKLKAILGKSISEYVKEIRLEKATELLLEKRWNVSEVTDKTGFSSISHFSRSFKKAYGKAPSEV